MLRRGGQLADKFKKSKLPANGGTTAQEQNSNREERMLAPERVHGTLKENEDYIRTCLKKDSAVLYRHFQAGRTSKRPALLVAVSGIVDKTLLNEDILGPVMNMEPPEDCKDITLFLRDSVLPVVQIQEITDLAQAVLLVLQGQAALFIEGAEKALLIGAESLKSRSIEQPTAESVFRGPKDSFVEDLQINISMIRRRIHDPQFRLETMTIGAITQTKVVFVYLEGIANDGVVKEVEKRLGSIKGDSILYAGDIEGYIQDTTVTLFPTISYTEKPDSVVARVLEGCVAILIDGTPVVLTVPDLLINHFQTSDDYTASTFFASFSRMIRIVTFLATIMLPGLFIAVQYYHVVLIPYSLLIRLIKAREGVPFQVYIEVFLLMGVFEVVKETGLRMPRPVGQAISVVGGLLLGTAAVDAGLVGLPAVVVVAFAGISTFLIPTLDGPITLLRVLFVIAGSLLGIYGILLLGMIVVTHLASLRSFGVPYTAPLFPIVWEDWKDTYLRLPIKSLWHRPKSLKPGDYRRHGRGGDSDENQGNPK